MKVVTADGDEIDLGTVEASPTIGIMDFSRRVTDDFGVTTIVERGFSRRLSVRLALPFDQVDSLQQKLAALRATSAQWIADEQHDWLNVAGFYKDFELDLAVPPLSFCTLTVEGLAETEAGVDAGGDPAPGGAPSSLRLLQPYDVTDASLVASNVAENDYPEWAGAATYAAGARVIKGALHRVFESVAAGNIGNDPAGEAGLWIDVGPTNRWAMFDQALGTTTTSAGSVAVTIGVSGDVNAFALLDVAATSVRVQAPAYDRTQSAATGAALFLDLPATNGQVIVTVTGPGQVSIGTLLVGRVVDLGVTEASPTAGIIDYSRKETDDFGEVTVVPRAWAKRMAAQALIRTDAIDVVANRIAAVRARPSLWIGDESLGSLTVYGFFKDFSITVGENVSRLSVTIEGLSKAASLLPVIPTTLGELDPAAAAALAATEAAIVAAQNAANAAQGTASGAATNANSALSMIGAIVNDGVLDRSEKPGEVLRLTAANDEVAGIVSSADALGVSRGLYLGAKASLDLYLNSLNPGFADTSADTAIDRAFYVDRWQNYYTHRQALLNAIAAELKARAAAAQTTGDNALTAGANAQATANQAVNDAADAATAASNAQGNASSALTEVTAMVSDGVLSKNEKLVLVQRKSAIDNEYAGINASASNVGVATTSHANAYNALTSYLGTVAYSNHLVNTNINRTTFNQKWVDYYTARQALLDAVAAELKARAAAAQTTANQASTAAANANAAAGAAQNDASSALTKVAAVANDGILDRSEKPGEVLRYSAMAAEFAGINASATAYAINTSDHANAKASLDLYLNSLNPAWTDYSADTSFDRAFYIDRWQNYYTNRQALLNAIAAEAGKRATWALTTGEGKPANYATVGAIVGGNFQSSPGVVEPINNVLNDRILLDAAEAGLDGEPTYSIKLPGSAAFSTKKVPRAAQNVRMRFAGGNDGQLYASYLDASGNPVNIDSVALTEAGIPYGGLGYRTNARLGSEVVLADGVTAATEAALLNARVPIGGNQVVNANFDLGVWTAPGQGISYPLGWVISNWNGTDLGNGYEGGIGLDSNWSGARVCIWQRGLGAHSSGQVRDCFLGLGDEGVAGMTFLARLRKWSLKVVPGDRVFARGLFFCHRVQARIGIRFFDANGGFVQHVGGEQGGRQWTGANLTYGLPANHDLLTCTATAPVGALFAVLWTYAVYSGQNDTFIFMVEPALGLLGPTQTVIPPYVAGPPDPVADRTVDQPVVSRLNPANGRAIDGRLLNPSNNYGLRALSSPPSFSSSAQVGSATVNLGADGVFYTDWGAQLALPSAGFPGLANTSKYFFWRNMTAPDAIGPSYGYSTNVNDALGVGKAYFGFYNTPASSDAGGGGGGGGYYGGGDCVWTEAKVATWDWRTKLARLIGRRDRMVALNQSLDDLAPVGCESNRPSTNLCCTIVTKSGARLTLAINTPITTRRGNWAVAANAWMVEVGVVRVRRFLWWRWRTLRWEAVIAVIGRGVLPVSRISCNDGTFAAGDGDDAFILTHNVQIKP